MNAMADLLGLWKKMKIVRFRSNVNGRIFCLVKYNDGCFQFVELENNEPEMWVKQLLYEGTNAFMVMNHIWKEVNDVS